MAEKRGQVTAFIIIGIVMLFAVMFFFYMRSDLNKIAYKENVPEGIIPLQRFIEECAEKTGRDAIGMTTKQGGWLDLPAEIKRNPFARLPIAPLAGVYIPYWYYRGTGNDGDLSPNLCKTSTECKYFGTNSVEEQIEKFVELKTTECINNFTAFKNIYTVKEKGILNTKVELSDNSVIVLIDYPLEVTDSSGRPTKMSKYRTEIPIRLKKMYELAQEIFKHENTNLFLENITIDLMSLNEKVVPLTDSMIKCSPYLKSMSEVKTNIKNLVNYNFPYIRINDTLQSQFILPEDKYANLHFRQKMDLEGKNYQDFAVDFSYEPNWPMNMQATPSTGAYLRADPLKLIDINLGDLGSFSVPACIINYHFNYDLEFPVLITIVDQETTEHEAGVFQFVTPVLINHNRGDRENYPIKVMPQFASPGTSEEYCKNFPTRPVGIKAYDKVTHEEIYGVNVSFKCIEFTCDVGQIESYRGEYILNANLPSCNYGTLITKYTPKTGDEDYFDTQKIGINSKTQDFAEIEILPKKTINFTIYKYKLSEPSTEYVLESGESVLIEIKNIEYDYKTTVISEPGIEGSNVVELIGKGDNTYSIDVMLIKQDALIGGYSANWTTSERELLSSEQLIIPVFSDETVIGDDQKQFDILVNMSEMSKKIPKPVFK